MSFGRLPKFFILNSSTDIEENILGETGGYNTQDYSDIMAANRWNPNEIFLTVSLNKH